MDRSLNSFGGAHHRYALDLEYVDIIVDLGRFIYAAIGKFKFDEKVIGR